MKWIFAVLLLVLSPLVFVTPIYAQYTGESVILQKDEVINKDYFAAGESVTILGTVNGDAYVAGGNITIDGTIDGDLLVAGGTVTIRGTVRGDVRATGGNITIAANAGKNVTAAGGNVTISDSATIGGSAVLAGGQLALESPLGRGATLAGGQVTIANEIDGDVWAGVGMITLTPEAKINGNLHYISDSEATILAGATIAGQTSREKPPQKSKEAQKTGQAVASGANAGFRIMNLLSALILGLLFVKFFPRFTEKTTETLRTNPWKALGLGVLVYLLFPMAFVFLLITVLGIPLAFILMFVLLLVAYLSKLFLALFIGTWLLQKLNWEGGQYIALILGIAFYFVLGSIPVLNFVTFLTFLFMGTGALLLTEKEYYVKLRSKKDI